MKVHGLGFMLFRNAIASSRLRFGNNSFNTAAVAA
jgi:hypothetical protein